MTSRVTKRIPCNCMTGAHPALRKRDNSFGREKEPPTLNGERTDAVFIIDVRRTALSGESGLAKVFHDDWMWWEK